MDKILKLIEAGVLATVAIFAPIQALLLTTGVMVVVDLLSGIIAAVKRKEPITSAGLRRTISKIFVYESAIMLAYLAEHYMSDILPFVKMASAMISVVELKSIYENLSAISGGNPALKVLIDKLGSTNQDDIGKK